jgi:hypothetical protein
MFNLRMHLAGVLVKKVLFACLLAIVAFSAFAVITPHAFAASTSHHLSANFAEQDSIFPATYFLGCGTGWNSAFDGIEFFQYAYTTGSQACSRAIWDDHAFTQGKSCNFTTYIPQILATANIAYGFYDSNNNLITRTTIDQNNVSGYVAIGLFISNVSYVLISSNNGQTGTYMAAAEMSSIECYW